MRNDTRKHHHSKPLNWKEFFDDGDNYLECDKCPDNEGYGNWNGRLSCGAWKCSVKKNNKEKK